MNAFKDKVDSVIANAVLMIEPVGFGFNQETAVNNFFQQIPRGDTFEIRQRAIDEFHQMVEQLKSNQIDVVVIKDIEQHSPDSVFPSDWLSFHENGLMVFYSMFATNRRLERRLEIPNQVEQHYGLVIKNVVDFSFGEDENRFLEGMGSMVLDSIHKIAYAALSERTDESLFLQYCNTFGYKPVCFSAYHRISDQRKKVYYTNLMLCIADTYAVVCADSIDNEEERNLVLDVLSKSGKEIICITEEQMHRFAANLLQLVNNKGQRFLVMSQSAYEAFTPEQIEKLENYNPLIVCNVPTIESVGGGSVRCMMAEIFR